jgi:dCMP deaminase
MKDDINPDFVNDFAAAANHYYKTKQEKMDRLYMDIAIRVSEMSFATRRKVGAVAVKENNILSFGWNGMPSGFNNCCEIDDTSDPKVIHAEMNLFAKLARTTGNAKDATLYMTDSPCWDCCKMIIQSGISRVVYKNEYRITEPIEFLREAGIQVLQLD